MSQEPIGLGFAGVGWLGESLIKALPATSRLRLAAVQDADAALAVDVAGRYASPWQGTELQALLRAPGVDAVVICTPNVFHVPQACAALEAGRHVLVQKPLATTSAGARQVLAVARQAERLLFVDYSYRLLETTAALRQAVGRLGPIQAVRGVFHNVYGPGKGWFFDPRLSGGGALVDLGVHLLDLAVSVLGPRDVALEQADLRFASGHAVEDAAHLRLRLGDTPMDLAVGWNADRPLTEIALQVSGEMGVARWENVDGSFFRFRTLVNGQCVLDRETTLRADTLRAFEAALTGAGEVPEVDVRVYDLVDAAYALAPWGAPAR